MSEYEITGGNKLYGEYKLQRAKNSVLTLICASVLTRGETLILDCPKIEDVVTLVKIMRRIGAEAEWTDEGLYLDTKNVYSTSIPDKLSCMLRASLFLVGPLLARFRTASLLNPGGCTIGSRPVDIHIEGLERLGAVVGNDDGRLDFYAGKLTGNRVRLRYPSVGATENIMMCATLAEGQTIIENCAQEPEIKDLQDYLNLCGAKISGAGTGKIYVYGVERLNGGISYRPISDRIECGSIMLAALAAGGEVLIDGANAGNICILKEKLQNNACKIDIYYDKIYMYTEGRPKGFGSVVTAPFPQFATDLHPQLAACASVADGKTRITETVFDSRFKYVDQLKKFGADLSVNGNTVTITGGRIHRAETTATDLRGGMALVIAALAAEGRSIVKDVFHIERGYERLEQRLSALGAKINKR